jgi:hypothetical protein
MAGRIIDYCYFVLFIRIGMGKHYFLTQDSEFCYQLDYFYEYMQENYLTELKIYEAQLSNDRDYFFCKEYSQCGERGSAYTNCGKVCDKYSPRNGKKGICRHYGPCYDITDKFRIVKLKEKNIKKPYTLKVVINNNVEEINAKDLKALTWKQPYAELMLHGKVETRTWKTSYRGWVLICAAQKPYDTNQIKSISGLSQLIRIINKLQYMESDYDGKAIAIAKLTDCRLMTPQDEDKCFVNYYEGLYCHIYSNVMPIKPIPFKGKLGFSNVSADIFKKIKLM